MPGICLTDRGGSTADGNLVVVAPCAGQAAQDWVAQPDQTLRFAGHCLDVGTGNRVDLASCTGSGTQQWRITGAGGGQQLQDPQSGLCPADPGDSVTSGTQLAAWSCAASDPGTSWRVR